MPRQREAAFTLIEMLAVVTIFALIAGFALPNFGTLSRRQLRRDAQQLAGQLELARQRSVVTGIPHRVLIDLDSAAYRMEWRGAPDDAEAPDLLPPPASQDTSQTPISLAAPVEEQREYAPLPGLFGRFTYLDGDLAFAGVETPAGWVDRGEVTIDFDRDGQSLVLEVLPLAEAVRIRDEPS
jgi:type II secretion system protein H